MAWEALRQRLQALTAGLTENDTLWQVKGPNGVVLHAHPAFLDAARITGDLDTLLAAQDQPLVGVLRRLRITLDSDLAQDMPMVRKLLGLAHDRFATTPEEMALLAHYRSAKAMGVVLGSPAVLADATAFADHNQAATAQDFVQLHAAYLAIAQGLRTGYDSGQHARVVAELYDRARTAATTAAPVPVRIGQNNDWLTFQQSFAQTVQDRAAQLNFGTVNALIAHAAKHVVVDGNAVPNKQEDMNKLITDYLTEARQQISSTDVTTVTSAPAQTGTTRTYYFGTVNVQVAMVAVDSTGIAWISTYYRPGRV